MLRKLLKHTIKIREKIYYKLYNKTIQSSSQGNKKIGELIEKQQPVAIGKIGSAELQAILIYKNIYKCNKITRNKILAKSPELAERDPKWLTFYRGNHLFQYRAGIFPDTSSVFERFSQIYLECLPKMDLLAVWFNRNEAKIIKKFAPSAQLTDSLGSLEPYFHTHPWSQYLKHKKVLVVHPFTDSIQYQYKRRELLWCHIEQEILPEFDLKTLRVPQNPAVAKPWFNDWFETLEYLKNEILKYEFDVCIVGAGGWSIPLVTYAKNLGKVGIHLGGATQILFGIKGRRWDNKEKFKRLYNKNWIRVLDNELPDMSKVNKINSGDQYW